MSDMFENWNAFVQQVQEQSREESKETSKTAAEESIWKSSNSDREQSSGMTFSSNRGR